LTKRDEGIPPGLIFIFILEAIYFLDLTQFMQAPHLNLLVWCLPEAPLLNKGKLHCVRAALSRSFFRFSKAGGGTS
jgi:hypothetical protein